MLMSNVEERVGESSSGWTWGYVRRTLLSRGRGRGEDVPLDPINNHPLAARPPNPDFGLRMDVRDNLC